MLSGSMRHLVKQSVLYTCVLSQPFVFYAGTHPALQNEQPAEIEQLSYTDHDKTAMAMEKKNPELASTDVLVTERNLQNFQDHHALTTTEHADQKILNMVISNKNERYKAHLEDMSGSVEPNMDPSDIEVLQRTLDHFDYYQGEIDGLYGPLTQKAVKKAEKVFGMELINRDTAGNMYEKEQSNKSDNSANHTQNAAATQNERAEQREKQTEQVKQKEQKPEKTKEIKQVKSQDNQHQQAIKAAREQIGTPYDWGGESPDGFDCSGFIQYIFKMEDISVPRTVNDMWNFAAQVDSPSIGDLVFFETYKPGPSHMGIYIGNNQFIHAGESRGVEKSKLSNPYWDERYIGAGKVQ